MSLPYTEGSVFLVPLRNGGYARGVVARCTRKGRVLFGYFFGPKLASPEEATLADLKPTDAILSIQFGDLGLYKGEWLVVGSVLEWDRSQWPMPDFVQRDEISRKAWLVRYSDNDPNLLIAHHPIDYNAPLPKDSLSGYGAVEIKLTKLLNP